MSQIIAIDYGLKRSGIANTDDLQMIAFGLTAVDTTHLMPFLKKYLKVNKVDIIVVGESKDLHGGHNPIETNIEAFIKDFKKEFPEIQIEREDERFTSKMASHSLLEMGKKKKDRQNKYLIDEMSATLILQSYLENTDK